MGRRKGLKLRMAIGGRKHEATAAENIDAILRLEKQEEQKLALHHRIFHTVGGFCRHRALFSLAVPRGCLLGCVQPLRLGTSG